MDYDRLRAYNEQYLGRTRYQDFLCPACQSSFPVDLLDDDDDEYTTNDDHTHDNAVEHKEPHSVDANPSTTGSDSNSAYAYHQAASTANQMIQMMTTISAMTHKIHIGRKTTHMCGREIDFKPADYLHRFPYYNEDKIECTPQSKIAWPRVCKQPIRRGRSQPTALRLKHHLVVYRILLSIFCHADSKLPLSPTWLEGAVAPTHVQNLEAGTGLPAKRMFHLIAEVIWGLLDLACLLVDRFQVASAALKGLATTCDLYLQKRADLAGYSLLTFVRVPLADVFGLGWYMIRYGRCIMLWGRKILFPCTLQLISVRKTNLAELEVQLLQERDVRELSFVRSSAGAIENNKVDKG
ncbi:unnamed protein product [Phytophthora fragariaefolia]|uniref:Unnamed protein product n=1 Tax=Phytophthora fragariaefolia TaxID=1490495 RepID=A0A9W6XJQ4_9STRA|nr:unnamed protein product [Phytophthora fragariaefolia]